MAISEKLKKLIKTLGGVPHSDTIEGAVDDLVGLFEEKIEVKMVEIVSEQSFIGMHDPVSHVYSSGSLVHGLLVAGEKYNIVINGEELQKICVAEYNVNRLIFGAFGEEEYLSISIVHGSNDIQIQWGEGYGDTITIAIYEEQVTVTPPVVSVAKNPDMVITLDGCGITHNIVTDVVTITSGTVSDVIEKMVKGIPVDVRVRGFFNNNGYRVESGEVKANVVYYGGVLHINYIVSHMTGENALAKHIAINEDGVIIEVNNRSINVV